VLFVVGALLQHFLIRRVLGLGDMPQIFLTFALSLLLMNVALLLFTANYRTVHTAYSDESIHLGALYVPVAKLIAFALAMAFSGILWLFLHATDLGKAMRAAAQNPDVAMLMGINPHRVFAVAFGAALALAGLADGRSGVRADGVCRRRFGHARQRHRRAYRQPDDGHRRIARHPVRRRRFGADCRVRHAPPDAGDQAERSRRRAGAMTDKHRTWLWLGALTAIVLVLPLLVTNRFATDIFIRILLFAFIGVAWNLMGGYAKQLSLGHAAYFGLGAYTSTILEIRFGISPWLGMVAGGVVAMLASLPIGWLCFRLRGPYFAIATIATAQVLMLLFLKFRDFAWGAEGTTIPNFGDAPRMMQFDDKSSYYYVALGLLALGLIITYRIEHSWMGYYLVAIGEDEDAAEAVGVNAPRIKRDIYMISAFLTALAGTFYVQYIYFIDPATAFSFNISVEAALVSIVGGIGTLWGPVVGTVLLETTSALLQSWLGSSAGGVQLTVYSLILIAVILWRPSGLLGVFSDVYRRMTRARPPRAEEALLDG
jgi:branched-chain amino acid transport system permease protein